MAVAKADLLPLLAMVIVQFVFAGMNITSKLAMDSGLKPLVLVAYRQVFATIAMLPLAYFFEWKNLPPITRPLLFQIFICSLTGAATNQVLYFIGLQNSTPTIGCALANLLPAVTFILALLFRQESLQIKKMSGQAKVLGTMLCVGGAMLLSFYHGHTIDIGQSKLHWRFADDTENQVAGHKSSPVLGSLLIIGSSISWATWFTVQAKVSSNFPAPYTSTFLMCLMGSVECMIIGLSINHQISEWSLKSLVRLLTILYAGIVCSAIGYTLTSWSIQKKGALYVSVFNPLLLVIVAVVSWGVLREKLYIGTVIGSLLIILGLYAVLWGKNEEGKSKVQGKDDKDTASSQLMMHKEADIEMQLTTN